MGTEDRKIRPEDSPGFGYPIKVREVDVAGTCLDCGPKNSCYRIMLEVCGGPDDGKMYWAGACHFELK